MSLVLNHHHAIAELATLEREQGLQFERCGDVHVRAEACAHNSPICPFAFQGLLRGVGVGEDSKGAEGKGRNVVGGLKWYKIQLNKKSQEELTMFKDFNTKTYEKTITPFLNQGEKVISCGSFETKPSATARVLTLGVASVANRIHYIAVTSERVIVIPFSRSKIKPSEKDVFSVSYDEVGINKKDFSPSLAICKPGADKPSKYFFKFGMKALSGIDKEEFIDAIEQRKSKK